MKCHYPVPIISTRQGGVLTALCDT
ncbi:hypothetical protein CBM2592_A90001 [Cupriavidus taiwanensis]|nr:hypothetical protein CBM2592_A90001 [Cupriavidus taiwanensis]SOY90608.1 hypothetical protein CBM2591_A90001 [Cupriavidus taiwanensis]SOZ63161.1 hypothetical protein CBM2617_A60001 [Cupriavidus taiwanensis]SPD41504.1 protein of unknown function [Cupriavidus taiwanensis]